MYYGQVKQFMRTLNALDGVLEKGIKHAEAKKFDPNVYTTLRLIPDMLPFTRQIQFACDAAKVAAANLTGRDNPKHEDHEQTMDELRARIRKCLAFLETCHEQDFKKIDATRVTVKVGNPTKGMLLEDALLARWTPNFYFHVSVAYALLRQSGVEIGKSDILGKLPTFEA